MMNMIEVEESAIPQHGKACDLSMEGRGKSVRPCRWINTCIRFLPIRGYLSSGRQFGQATEECTWRRFVRAGDAARQQIIQ